MTILIIYFLINIYILGRHHERNEIWNDSCSDMRKIDFYLYSILILSIGLFLVIPYKHIIKNIWILAVIFAFIKIKLKHFDNLNPTAIEYLKQRRDKLGNSLKNKVDIIIINKILKRNNQ